MISGPLLALLILLLILFEQFFSGSEIALTSSNKPLLLRKLKPDSLLYEIVDRFQKEPQRLLSACVIGTNTCVVASSTLATFYFRNRTPELGELYTLLIISPFLLILGEMAPKMAYQHYADKIAPKSFFGIWLFSILLFPAVWLLGLITGIASRLLGGKRGETQGIFSRSELQHFLLGAKNREMPAHAQKMIRRVFRFSETTVSEVMIPLVEVKAVSESQTVKEVLEMASRTPFTHYPVYQDRIDNIIGIIKTKELLAVSDQTQNIKNFMHPPFFVPEVTPVDELLARMQRENFLMAVVVDEYGGCIGIVTREDILEEIIGEIHPEHETEKPLYRQISPNQWLINARMEIDQINEIFGWELPKEKFETLAGFLLNLFQRIPRAGELIRFKNLIFLIKRSSPRAILEVMVTKEESIEEGERTTEEG